MKTGWETKKLGEVIQLEYGKPLADSDRNPHGLYPAYGANGIKDRSDKFYKDAPSIIVGRKGSAGEVTLTEDRYWPLDVTFFVEFDRTKYELQYLYFLLLTLNLPSMAKGVKPGINRNDVYDITVTTSNIEEQRRIVTLLDEAFANIATAKANAEKNLQNARALFESHLQNVFTRRGEGWVEKSLSEICQIKPPKSEAKNALSNNAQVSFAPMEDLGINQKYLNAEKSRTLIDVVGSYTYFAEGDVLLAKITPCFENGKLGIAKGLINGIGFGSSEYIVFRTSQDLFNEYLYYFLSRKQFIEEGAARMSGAVGHKRVSKEFIEEYKISYPSISSQKTIVRKIDSVAEEIQRLESMYRQKLTALDDLKKSLLHKAFAGEL